MHQVLFICSGNYYRSRFAEILFSHLAVGQGLPWTAQSRGFRLSPQNVGNLSSHTIAACRARGLPFDPQRGPQVLSEADLLAATRIIAMKESEHRAMMRERFSEWVDRIEYWNIHDIDVATPAAALPLLEHAVSQLVSELAMGNSRTMP
jgi:protein-tyrosine phosphatase